MARKAKGKYAAGQEPHVLLGIERAAFYKRVKMAGPLGDEAREAQRRALEIAGEDVEHEDVAPIEAAPAPAPATSDPAQHRPAMSLSAPLEPPPPAVAGSTVPAMMPKAPTMLSGPATTLSLPSEAPPPAVAGATVNVTFRCPPAVHDRMREMAHKKRVKLQGIVGAAVEAYLSQNGF